MSETATLTLSDFLLARIAEDEAMAHRGRLTDGQSAHLLDIFEEARVAGAVSQMLVGSFNPARVLAECAAKRRIVEDWQSLAERLDDQGRPLHLFDPVTSMLLKATEPWLRALATGHADHPDYRQEWRP